MLARAHESVGEKEYREFLDRLKKQTSQRLKGQTHEHRSHHYGDSRNPVVRAYPPAYISPYTGKRSNPSHHYLSGGYRTESRPGPRPGLDPTQVQHTTVALVGWKGAGVTINDGIIVSSHGATEWPAYERLTAECNRDYHPRGACVAPEYNCNCGIHAGIKAMTAHSYALGGARSLRGQDASGRYQQDRISCLIETNLWGTIMVNETGYRAQYAYPKSVVLIADSVLNRMNALVQERVRNRYGVPVEIMGWSEASKFMGEHS